MNQGIQFRRLTPSYKYSTYWSPYTTLFYKIMRYMFLLSPIILKMNMTILLIFSCVKRMIFVKCWVLEWKTIFAKCHIITWERKDNAMWKENGYPSAKCGYKFSTSGAIGGRICRNPSVIRGYSYTTKILTIGRVSTVPVTVDTHPIWHVSNCTASTIGRVYLIHVSNCYFFQI
jgi:hypothetical protein